jgi:endonuclease/exonuclease/phosphatase family metal-dependent hydrolase
VRIVTWNLRNGDWRRAWPRLRNDLRPDIAFLQEADSAPEAESVIWMKVPNANWGSAVATSLGRLRPITISGYEGWVVGGEIEGHADPVAVFSVHAPSSTKHAPRKAYPEEVVTIIGRIRQPMRPDVPLVIGGDFNFTLGERQPDESLQTSTADRRALSAIASAGLVSCWTAAHPDQPLPQTLRWSGDRSPEKATPYHCDGILVPAAWSGLVTCAVHADECFKVSDHNPVSATVTFPTTPSPPPTPPTGW